MIDLIDLRQQTDYDCGVVCCQIVWEFFGLPRRRVPASQIDGTDPRTIEAALRQAGLPVLSGEMSLSDLSHFARTRRPTIVLLNPPAHLKQVTTWSVGGSKIGDCIFSAPPGDRWWKCPADLPDAGTMWTGWNAVQQVGDSGGLGNS
jgi:hypothetical protein